MANNQALAVAANSTLAVRRPRVPASVAVLITGDATEATGPGARPGSGIPPTTVIIPEGVPAPATAIETEAPGSAQDRE